MLYRDPTVYVGRKAYADRRVSFSEAGFSALRELQENTQRKLGRAVSYSVVIDNILIEALGRTRG